jgi:hypothetical protein
VRFGVPEFAGKGVSARADQKFLQTGRERPIGRIGVVRARHGPPSLVMPGLFLLLRRRVSLPLVCAAGLVGCATTTPAPVPALRPEARLVIVNLAAQAWELSLTPAGSAVARVEHVPPQATREVALAAGEYAVEQALLAAGGDRAAARRLLVRLEAGRTYRWPLALLEPEAGTAAVAAVAEAGAGR